MNTSDDIGGQVQQAPRPYGLTSMALHWITAAMMAAILALAWVMTSLPTSAPHRLDLYRLHKSLGLTVLLIAVLRLWLRRRRPGSAPLDESAWARWAAATTHALLYILLLVMPISGYVMSSAAGYPVTIWNVPLPSLPKDHLLAGRAEQLHLAAQWALYGLIAVHLAGVVWHVWFRRDALIDRMLPPQRSREMAHTPPD